MCIRDSWRASTDNDRGSKQSWKARVWRYAGAQAAKWVMGAQKKDCHVEVAMKFIPPLPAEAYIETKLSVYADEMCIRDRSSSACSSDQGETCLMEGFSQRLYLRLVLAADGNQYRTGQRERGLSGFLSLVEGFAKGGGKSENLTGGTHFRSKHRIHLREHVEGERCV